MNEMLLSFTSEELALLHRLVESAPRQRPKGKPAVVRQNACNRGHRPYNPCLRPPRATSLRTD
jgi:hypothetical protein